MLVTLVIYPSLLTPVMLSAFLMCFFLYLCILVYVEICALVHMEGGKPVTDPRAVRWSWDLAGTGCYVGRWPGVGFSSGFGNPIYVGPWICDVKKLPFCSFILLRWHRECVHTWWLVEYYVNVLNSCLGVAQFVKGWIYYFYKKYGTGGWVFAIAKSIFGRTVENYLGLTVKKSDKNRMCELVCQRHSDANLKWCKIHFKIVTRK